MYIYMYIHIYIYSTNVSAAVVVALGIFLLPWPPNVRIPAELTCPGHICHDRPDWEMGQPISGAYQSIKVNPLLNLTFFLPPLPLEPLITERRQAAEPGRLDLRSFEPSNHFCHHHLSPPYSTLHKAYITSYARIRTQLSLPTYLSILICMQRSS